jgi:hypothetical protein
MLRYLFSVTGVLMEHAERVMNKFGGDPIGPLGSLRALTNSGTGTSTAINASDSRRGQPADLRMSSATSSIMSS